MAAVAYLLGATPRDLAEARAGRRSLPDLVWKLLEKTAGPWLMVMDDCGQEDSASDSGPFAWARPSRKGLVILTTRPRAGASKEGTAPGGMVLTKSPGNQGLSF